MKNEALVLVKLKCFLEANVKQHGTVERSISWLFHEKVIVTILKTTSQQNSPQGGTSYGVWRGNDIVVADSLFSSFYLRPEMVRT